jgi:hypothetical protein
MQHVLITLWHCKQVVLVREEPVDYFPEIPPEPLLLPPVDFQPIWDDRNTGSKFGDVTIWKPLAPHGYRALGHIASMGNRVCISLSEQNI